MFLFLTMNMCLLGVFVLVAEDISQLIFICSKLTIEKVEKDEKHVHI